MHYLEIFRAFKKAHVRYLVAGGVALNLHGVPRMTADLDLVVALDSANLDAVLTALEEAGFVSSLPVNPREMLAPEIRQRWLEEKNLLAFPFHNPSRTFEAVDLLIQAPVDFESAWTRRTIVRAGELDIPVLDIDELIRLKRSSGRPQDLADADALTRLKTLREDS